MPMTHTTCHVTISLDGFLAGADQTLDTPLGVGGEDLHRWMFPADEERTREMSPPVSTWRSPAVPT